MWTKFLYFFRIYKSTGYLIRMLIQVAIDMQVFLLVMIIIICGIANSFVVLSVGSTNNSDFVGSGSFFAEFEYVYRIILGDFDTSVFTDSVQPLMAWFLFFIATLMIMIIMLNLLISIIGETFSQFNENYVLAGN